MRSFLSRRRRAAITAAVIVALSTALAACSSTSSTPSSSHAASADVSAAKTVLAAALKGVVSAKSASQPLTALTAFNGPSGTETSAPSDVSMVGVASCQDPCSYVGDLVGSIGKQADGATYSGSVGNGPQDWQSLTTQAINQKPKVIVFNGVADGAVLQQVAAAKKAGIKTVGISVEQSVPGDQGYDAYVSVRQDLAYRTMLNAAIADSNGTANVILFEPSGFASTDRYVAAAKKEFLRECPNCSIDVEKEDTGNLVSPTTLDSIVTSALNANSKANYLLFGDDFYALSAAQQAARRLNRTVTMIAQDGSTAGLAAVKSGILKYDAGVPLEWISYAGYDAIRRLLTGQQLLAPNGWGGGVHLWSATNLPSAVTNAAATDIWRSFIDYPSDYSKLWGK